MRRRRRLTAPRRTWWWYRSRPAKYAGLHHWKDWLAPHGSIFAKVRQAHLWPLCEYGYLMGLDALDRQWREVARGWWAGGTVAAYSKKYQRVAAAVRKRRDTEGTAHRLRNGELSRYGKRASRAKPPAQ